MNNRIFKEAVNDIKAHKELIDKTKKRMMEMNLSETTTQRAKRRFIFPKIAVACALVIVITFVTMGQFSKIPLQNSSGNISVRYVKNPVKANRTSDLLIELSEKQLVDMSDVIVYGKAVGLDHIKIDFAGEKEYRTVVSVKVSKVYKGQAAEAEVIKFLAPVVLDGSVWVEDTGVISQLAEGDEGFFLLKKYDNESYWEQNGARLVLSDISDYGMGDGERFAFISKNNSFVFAQWAYKSLAKNPGMEDIENFINNNIR